MSDLSIQRFGINGTRKNPYLPQKVGFWEKTKAFFQGFGEYYKDKYEDTEGIGDFFQRTKAIHDEGAEMIDNATFDKVKNPIKNWSQSVAARVDDGDDSKLSFGERMWAMTEGVGTVGDKLFSTKGVEATGLAAGCIAIAAGGAVAAAGAIGGAEAATTTGAAIGVVANAAGTVGGVVLTGKGVYDVTTADTKEEAKKGGTELGSGSMMLALSASTAKSTLNTARQAGLTNLNPEELTTIEAMAENIKITGSLIKKIPTGNEYGFIVLPINSHKLKEFENAKTKAILESKSYDMESMEEALSTMPDQSLAKAIRATGDLYSVEELDAISELDAMARTSSSVPFSRAEIIQARGSYDRLVISRKNVTCSRQAKLKSLRDYVEANKSFNEQNNLKLIQDSKYVDSLIEEAGSEISRGTTLYRGVQNEDEIARLYSLWSKSIQSPGFRPVYQPGKLTSTTDSFDYLLKGSYAEKCVMEISTSPASTAKLLDVNAVYSKYGMGKNPYMFQEEKLLPSNVKFEITGFRFENNSPIFSVKLL